MKGRGLNIHMSRTKCRSTLERRNRICKSKTGSPLETNHSGSTETTNLTRENSTPAPGLSIIEEGVKAEEKVKAVQERSRLSPTGKLKTNKTSSQEPSIADILIIDDEVEKSIKKEVLTLPQCVEKKIKGIRNVDTSSGEHKENIVILHEANNKLGKGTTFKKEKNKPRKNVACKDIREYVSLDESRRKKYEGRFMKSVVVKKQSDIRQVIAGERTKSTREPDINRIVIRREFCNVERSNVCRTVIRRESYDDDRRSVIRRESYEDDRSNVSRTVVRGETYNDKRSDVRGTVVRRKSLHSLVTS